MNTVQPIRDKKKIEAMKKILRGDKDNGMRNYILFSLGINTGLRISDILKLNAGDVIGKDHITLIEQKTDKTKRFPLNKALQKDLSAYIKDNNMELVNILFPSRKGTNKPITRIQAYRIIRDAAIAVEIDEIGTHTLRKTFGYHFYKKYHDVVLLQEIFNHSSPAITLRYIGINDDQIKDSIDNFYL